MHRLIPAHAGSTGLTEGSVSTALAHPRSRGVDTYQNVTDASLDGSSPLTRGRRPASSQPEAQIGLIPAHAGSTACAHV